MPSASEGIPQAEAPPALRSRRSGGAPCGRRRVCPRQAAVLTSTSSSAGRNGGWRTCCDRVDRASFQCLGLMKGPGRQQDGIAGAADSFTVLPSEYQPAADDEQDLVDSMGVVMMHLACSIPLQFN